MIINNKGLIISLRKISKGKICKIFYEKGIINGFIKTKSKDVLIDVGSFVNFSWYGNEDALGIFVLSNSLNILNLNNGNEMKKVIASALIELFDLFFHENIQVSRDFFYLINSFYKKLFSTKVEDAMMNFCLIMKYFLEEVGYGLSLDRCKVSGMESNLVYLSPKSGCAISESIGKPYSNLMFDLPD